MRDLYRGVKEVKDVDYNDIFTIAKGNAVLSHAMVWIRAIVADEKTVDAHKFEEIERIIEEANKHLKD